MPSLVSLHSVHNFEGISVAPAESDTEEVVAHAWAGESSPGQENTGLKERLFQWAPLLSLGVQVCIAAELAVRMMNPIEPQSLASLTSPFASGTELPCGHHTSSQRDLNIDLKPRHSERGQRVSEGEQRFWRSPRQPYLLMTTLLQRVYPEYLAGS